MQRVRITDDGFTTLFSAEFNQFYHSVRGALDETQRVYIELGLLAKMQETQEISILELGFGTGLNALITAGEAKKNQLKVHYTSLEPFPISEEDVKLLNYQTDTATDLLQRLHSVNWEENIEISSNFSLKKVKSTLQDFKTDELFDVVYYDAFAPSSQPELWTVETFTHVASFLKKGGFLTTYCSKTIVRRAMEQAGFKVEKHVGIWGKREVVRAIKL
ncbi:tRNA (5-methylaminomethyl-2-thiouridine)(34)-methyltransferase MnmD [Arcicella sp. DC2W]|uniref:tRNA (5-methylaminomethyl-2-thiouridine)(34)-methyltransferase MnmD n=1 Tax=Arcicella gelida TaxID=2984195 RepID=A0ABU5S488_9BACT|nr:tRNA (5-methylaminomethyl-2-thiouridine)(34)-methyltransferase MnmD [Arcicella sp. DC2W]MEA5403038.1 tRNA (5-methylaminomethyl-2-thiouridine)(34)-methyltransferase MnmD [Arcicella sp. DC2W]